MAELLSLRYRRIIYSFAYALEKPNTICLNAKTVIVPKISLLQRLISKVGWLKVSEAFKQNRDKLYFSIIIYYLFYSPN